MKNVTITLEEEVALWVRIEAAKQETSVSRLVWQKVVPPSQGTPHR